MKRIKRMASRAVRVYQCKLDVVGEKLEGDEGVTFLDGFTLGMLEATESLRDRYPDMSDKLDDFLRWLQELEPCQKS